jgi:hypothetical protein
VTAQEFRATLSHPSPPSGLTPALTALWQDGRGDWDAAHRIAQDVAGRTGAWIHAYLHRKEGDLSNAAYWYRAAGRTMPESPHLDEWLSIVETLLSA